MFWFCRWSASSSTVLLATWGLCDFIGLDLSSDDIERFARPQNVRMSRLMEIAAELLSDDGFFSFYSNLEEYLGRERVEEFLDSGERAQASLEGDDLADLKARAGAGNRLLAQSHRLELERFGYALAASSPGRPPAKVQATPVTGEASDNRLQHLQTVIDTQRRAHASQLHDLEATFDAQREVFLASIREFETTLQREREGFAAHFGDFEAAHQREREAFLARIKELDATLQNERGAFLAWIGELEATVANERGAYGEQLIAMKTTMDAERQAFAARIQELEATLQAEREGFIGRISELAEHRRGLLGSGAGWGCRECSRRADGCGGTSDRRLCHASLVALQAEA